MLPLPYEKHRTFSFLCDFFHLVSHSYPNNSYLFHEFPHLPAKAGVGQSTRNITCKVQASLKSQIRFRTSALPHLSPSESIQTSLLTLIDSDISAKFTRVNQGTPSPQALGEKHPVPKTAGTVRIYTSCKPLERKHSSGCCWWYFNSPAFVLCAPKSKCQLGGVICRNSVCLAKLTYWMKFGSRINCIMCLLSRAEEISIRACQENFFKQLKIEHGRLNSCKENLFIN